MKTITIWELQTYGDGMLRLYFFATKKDAMKAFREREEPTKEDIVTSHKFSPGRQGMAEALNWLIDSTCHNEG